MNKLVAIIQVIVVIGMVFATIAFGLAGLFLILGYNFFTTPETIFQQIYFSIAAVISGMLCWVVTAILLNTIMRSLLHFDKLAVAFERRPVDATMSLPTTPFANE